MKRRNLLKEYGSRVIRKTLVQVTGGVGFLVAAILQILFSHVLILPFYVIVLVTGLVVGSYFVFADLVKEFEAKENAYKHKISELEVKVSELEDAQPRITVGFQDDAPRLVKRLQLQLRPLPPEPDFDAVVEEKRGQLVAKQRDYRSLPLPDWASALDQSIFGKLNPNYWEDVEQYLIEYRDYLVKRYERRIAKERTRSVQPVVENWGYYPANNVTIEFAMPETYETPAKHQRCDSWLSKKEMEGLELTEAEHWQLELEDERICGLPEGPKLVIGQWFSSTVLAGLDRRSLRAPLSRIQEISNTSGPVHEDRDGVHYILYHIKQLVQHRPEDDFEALFLWLGDVRDSTIWKISVTITSADLRNRLKQVLELDIRIAEHSESA